VSFVVGAPGLNTKRATGLLIPSVQGSAPTNR
jgi:hypothetical protein